jgi:hypothetical protein
VKIEEYKLVQGFVDTGVDTFSARINSAIREGWQPYGPPSIGEKQMFQCVVRYRKKEGKEGQPISPKIRL